MNDAIVLTHGVLILVCASPTHVDKSTLGGLNERVLLGDAIQHNSFPGFLHVTAENALVENIISSIEVKNEVKLTYVAEILVQRLDEVLFDCRAFGKQ